MVGEEMRMLVNVEKSKKEEIGGIELKWREVELIENKEGKEND